MANIVLVMIVKNESKIIQRCLTSAKSIISAFSIVDTGSTDNTVELVQNWSKENNIKGQIITRPWKNFGHNRTESFVEAKKYVKEQGFDLDNTFALFLDADMILVVPPSFKHTMLKDKGYTIKQFHHALEYYNLRLARFDCDWKCVGVTHEYWACGLYDSKRFEHLKIDDKEDGGAKADKFERDKNFLLEGLKEEPNNSRYMFYLGQTYYCLKDYENSLEWYKKRIKAGGWYEEVWYSYYKVVHNYIRLEKIHEAIEWCLKGYRYNPHRAESFDELASFLRKKDLYELAYMILSIGEKIPYPVNDKLFIQKDTYSYNFFETKLLTAYYVNKFSEGADACEKMFLSDAPIHKKNLALSNIHFYIEKLPSTNITSLPSNSSAFINQHHCNILSVSDKIEYSHRTISNMQQDSSNLSLDLKQYLDQGYIHCFTNFIDSVYGSTTLSKLVDDKREFLTLKFSIKPNDTNNIINTSNISYIPILTQSKQKLYVDNIKNCVFSEDKLLASLSLPFSTRIQTNGIEFGGGYLFILVLIDTVNKRVYNKFYWVSKDLTKSKSSKSFYIDNKGDELVHSITLNKKRLYITYSSNKECKIIACNVEDINKLL